MKKYYEVSDTPLNFHYFFWYAAIPLGSLFLIKNLMGDFAYLSDNAYSDASLLLEIEIFFLFAELILRVICFVGFFKWSKDAWYSLMSLLSLGIIYNLLFLILYAVYFPGLMATALSHLIGATIFAILVGLYYLKRKPLFFDDIFPTLPVHNEKQQTALKAEERIAAPETDSSILQRNIAPLGPLPKDDISPAPEKTKKQKKDSPKSAIVNSAEGS